MIDDGEKEKQKQKQVCHDVVCSLSYRFAAQRATNRHQQYRLPCHVQENGPLGLMH